MLLTCFYYDQIEQKYHKTNYYEMIDLEKEDYAEFVRRKANICRREDGKIPMVLVKNGLHHGFRRKALTGGNGTDYSRGEKESLTHQGNKEIIANMKEIVIKFGNVEVKVYVKNAECEKTIVCNGKRYEVDIYIQLEKTEPADYYKLWNGELWLEIFHSCKVDYEQAENFAIENKTLFEYKVNDDYNFFNNISEEGYEKRKKYIEGKYCQKGIEGIMICQSRNNDNLLHTWTRSSKGNMRARIGDSYFTIIKSKYGTNYGIVYGEKLIKWDYNNKKFDTEKNAMKVAEYFAFLLYNKEKIKEL